MKNNDLVSMLLATKGDPQAMPAFFRRYDRAMRRERIAKGLRLTAAILGVCIVFAGLGVGFAYIIARVF